MTKDTSNDRVSSQENRPDISVLASTILSVIGDKGDEGAQTIRASIHQRLLDFALSPSTCDSEALLDEMRDQRIGSYQIIDTYIPQAAKEMGEMWSNDTIGFAQVTIGTARLQGLLTLLAPPWVTNPSDDANGLNVLFLLRTDDTHTLGPHVATAQMRRMGASVRIMFDASKRAVLEALSQEKYDLVLFSGSRPDAVASIAKIVKSITASLEVPPPLVLGGIVVALVSDVREKTKVDLVTNDVTVAFKLCEKNRSRNS